jgi:hypothetical protein
MGIGVGVVLLLVGLVLTLDVVSYDIPNVDDNGLGVLLIVAGIAAIVLSLIWASLASRRSRVDVDERPYGNV